MLWIQILIALKKSLGSIFLKNFCSERGQSRGQSWFINSLALTPALLVDIENRGQGRVSLCRLPVNSIQAFLEVSGQTSPKETANAQEQIHRESDRYDVEAG